MFGDMREEVSDEESDRVFDMDTSLVEDDDENCDDSDGGEMLSSSCESSPRLFKRKCPEHVKKTVPCIPVEFDDEDFIV